MTFTPLHRGGAGDPLVLLHGFTDTWRSWELVLPDLEREHDVLALTLPGHAGGPPLREASTAAVLDGVEAALDAAGLATAHLVGNSLGGYVALRLAARGRARSVVAFAPAGGWARGDAEARALLASQAQMIEQLRAAGPAAASLAASPAGRRMITRDLTVRYEHLPAGLLGHLVRGSAECPGAPALVAAAQDEGFTLDPARIACPVRIVWGTEDRLLPWPSAAARLRREWLPHADWVVLDGVGHCPQLDVPLEAAQLVLGFTR